MSRAVSPQGRRRIRTVIGRSNRRQVVNPIDGTFEVTRSTPTPGLDGTFYDGDLKSFLNATQQTNNNSFSRTGGGEDEDEGPVGPGLPLPNNPGRSASALSMNTIGNATICSMRQEEVSMEWANATGGFFEDTLGPDGGPRRSHSSMSQHRAGRATPWRRTDVTSVSATLSANPENTKERLTFATRRERLRNPPTALDLLNSLTKERKTQESMTLGRNSSSVLGLGGVTPGPMVFDEPKYMDCPTVPNAKMNSSIAKQFNGANDGRTATKGSSKVVDKDLSTPQAVGAGFCSNGAWVMKKQHHSPARGGATAADHDTNQQRHHNSLLSITNNSSPLRSRLHPSDVLSHVPSTTAPPKLRQERTKYGGTEHMVQAPKSAAGATYLPPAQQFTAVNRGLGASLEAQEKKLRALAAQQRRVERHAESERKAQLNAVSTERRDAERAKRGLERKSNLQRSHEASSKENHFRVQPPNSYEALMDP